MNPYAKLRLALPRLLTLDRQLEDVKINQGRILAELGRDKVGTSLSDHEFKVFSQWGEDGILQYLTRHVRVPNKTFIEFGVEDFSESNCRFLMMKDLWQGFVIDGSEENIARMRSSDFYWRYQLQSRCAFITRENVAELLDESGFERELGILSVDVDGMDWHLLQELGAWRAAIVIVEYNGLFGMDRSVTVPYSPDFYRTRAHPSNLYWGASLPAFSTLLNGRGYALVGVNGAGSNAFFVRRDLLPGQVPEVQVAQCFRSACFREGRDTSGNMTYKPAHAMAAPLADLPLLDTVSGERLRLGDLTQGAPRG